MLRFNYVGEESLSHPDVIRAAREHRVMVLGGENDFEVEVLLKKICGWLKPCQKNLAVAVSPHNVLLYVDYMLNTDWEYAQGRYATEDKRAKFLCELAGALLEHGVYMGTPGELARRLQTLGKTEESRRKYISQGRKMIAWRRYLSSVTSITNYPLYLCSIKQKRR